MKKRLSKKLFQAKVFNGKEHIYVKGTLQPLKEGVNVIHEGKEVKLFHSGRKWWLWYTWWLCTGSFPSKKRAVAWYTGNGR